jgi:RNA polymerase sigma factor (sigma-70 family)
MSRPPATLVSSSIPTGPLDVRAARTLQLFREWRAGDARAGEALFRDLRTRLRVFFRRQPPHLLDDLVQETLVACVVARRALRCEDALLGYVYTVARRVLLHHLRQRSLPTVEIDEDAADEDRPTPDRVLEVRRLVGDRLTPCTLLVMQRYVEGRRGVELARALDISEASVRRKVRRGLDELRRSASMAASG